MLLPVLFVVSASLSTYEEILKHGGFVIVPLRPTLAAYGTFLADPTIPRSYGVTVFITVVGTAVNLILTLLTAYPLSRKDLPGRKLLIGVIVVPLLFSGGLIPTYLVVKATGLLNSLWALIIPHAVWSYNVLIMRTFIATLEPSLFDAARIDGAGEWRVLAQVVVPLSLPSIATVGLYYGVAHWNEFLNAIFYVTDRSKYPLQVVLRNILVTSQIAEAEVTLPSLTLKMAAVVLTAAPIIAVYPFVQRFFTKGLLLGAVKG